MRCMLLKNLPTDQIAIRMIKIAHNVRYAQQALYNIVMTIYTIILTIKHFKQRHDQVNSLDGIQEQHTAFCIRHWIVQHTGLYKVLHEIRLCCIGLVLFLGRCDDATTINIDYIISDSARMC